MKTKTIVLALLFTVLMIAAAAPRCLAQAVTATLVGTVTDQAGSVIPNALVSITNQGTGTVTTANANESGNYNFT
ncbi:MAG: carboxypeptidase-like regulatory domain-containing protein, partial [Acidobacteriaceae bacterium]